MRGPVHYIPIVTMFVSIAFTVALLGRWRVRGGPHLLWWAFGALTYAAGTAAEAAVTLFGWQPAVFRWWYVTGALLGGAPLAQGTVYLLLRRRTAHMLSAALAVVVATAAVCVFLSPLRLELVEPHRLSGRVLGWQWVRGFSPFINLYALIFLVGGAALSAVRYARRAETWYRAVGNILIAAGALLPGIGGAFTRFGHVEVLYVTELVGLAMIIAGYRHITGHHPGVNDVRHPVPA